MNRFRSGNRRAVLGMASASTFVALTGGILAGCGSGGGTAPSPLYANLLGNGGTGVTSFAGRSYQSTVALAGGQVGNLTVTTSVSGNAASGTLSIVDPSRSAAKTRLVIATPFLSGTFDPTTGAIHLSGSYTFNGQIIPISITGTLPIPPSFTGGSITYVVGSQTYTSTFGGSSGSTNSMPSPSASPFPSASASPSPSPSSSPTPTPSPSAIPAPTAPVNTITITGGTTNVLHALTNTNSIGAGIFHSAPVTGGGYISFTLKNGSSNSADQASLEVDIKTGATLAPGTFPIVGPSGIAGTAPGVTSVSYGEFSGGFRNYQALPYKGLSGQVVVETVTPTLVRIRLVNVRIDRYDPLGTGPADTQILNGTLETSAVIVAN